MAKPDPKEALDVVRRACSAPADAVAIKSHLTKGALALMRIEQGHMRMRKSIKRPRDMHELTRRIRDMDTSEDQGSDGFKRTGRS